jgi:hypothetical protein
MDRRKSNLAAMVEGTPDSRDRYVDLLRAFSIAVVVLGHWLMAVVYFDGKGLSGASALDVVPGLWLLTWILQVMPIFFIVGGFSNLVAWRSVRKRGDTYADYMRSRTARLMRPTLVFVLAWTAITTVANFVSQESFEAMSRATELIAKPLWFLAVYVLVVALSPMMAAFHERYGVRVLAFLAGAAVIVDVVRIAGGMVAVGYLNFAFVWLFAHQLGYFYADGALAAFSRRFYTGLALGSLCLLAVLTGSSVYSPSMVGMQTESASNNSPPSICLVVMTHWLLSVAMLVRPAASRWLQRRKVWSAVVAANSMIMTVFLWHLTALLVAVLALFPIGFPQPLGGTSVWWAWRPVWIAVLVVVLAGFVAVFSRFERPARNGHASSARRLPGLATIAAVASLVLGLAGFAQFGFAWEPSVTAAQLPSQAWFNTALVIAGSQTLATRRRSLGG